MDLPTSYALCGGITTSVYSMKLVQLPAHSSVELITPVVCSALLWEERSYSVALLISVTYLLII